jgi:hypothetical protein
MAHYHGKKCTYDAITFDSIDEKKYYLKLINDVRVDDLKVHPKFIILDGFRNNQNKMIRSITFKPDFMYKLNGQTYIDDVKPINKKLIDADFVIRWKLLEYMYRDQDVIFRLIAWDKKQNDFVEV